MLFCADRQQKSQCSFPLHTFLRDICYTYTNVQQGITNTGCDTHLNKDRSKHVPVLSPYYQHILQEVQKSSSEVHFIVVFFIETLIYKSLGYKVSLSALEDAHVKRVEEMQ